MHDLIIRGGTVVDGTGTGARSADVAVADGVITEVGAIDGPARRVVDADGALVAPGFVDIHTHYDGQATWDHRLAPSSWHGVTTVVMGNCGVGFAPCRPGDHERIIELMEGVEDIPGTALHEGIPWTWESFEDYLDHLGGRSYDVDVGTQVPHGAVRLYVMGERGARGEPATPADIVEMGRLTRAAIGAGALGFTTSRTTNHRTSRGEATPTLRASAEELVGIARAMTGAGVIQVVSDFSDLDAEFAMVRDMVEASGCPLSISVAAEEHRAPWHALRDRINAASADGLPVRGQVGARAIGVVLGLQTSFNPVAGAPAYREVAGLPAEERAAALAEPSRRAALITHLRQDAPAFERLFPLDDPPDYEPPPGASIAARAVRQGSDAAELAVDVLLADGGRGLLYLPFHNWVDGSLDTIGAMLREPHLVPGLSDGGAHVGTICDASYPTTLLAHWARDRVDGLPLEWVVARQCRATAEAAGLGDRGVLAPGFRADVNVIDHDALRARRPYVTADLPAGGRRLLQRADGYLHTFVRGVETYADGEPTEALPGRLVRGQRPQPRVGRT